MTARRAVVMVVALGLGACAEPRPAPAKTLQGALEQIAARTILTYAARGLTPAGLVADLDRQRPAVRVVR